MLFIKQIGHEIKNILKSKFILIIAILVLAISIGTPVVNFISEQYRKKNPYPDYYYYDYGYSSYGGYGGGMWFGEDGDPIIIDGITVNPDNPYYSSLRSIQYEKEYLTEGMSWNPEALDFLLLMMEEEESYYAKLAMTITSFDDYRADLAWNGLDSLQEKFIFEKSADIDPEALADALMHRRGLEKEIVDERYVNITPEERLKAIDAAQAMLDTIFEVAENNDFPQYIALRIAQEEKNILDMQEQIEIKEKMIIENPSMEEWTADEIKYLKREIEMIETNNIQMLEYRLENQIIPGGDSWENQAIASIENNRMQLLYNEIISEEEFNQEIWLAREYGTYKRYVAAKQKENDSYNNKIIVAQKSLDANKPDMEFVTNGARQRTIDFLSYSVIVAIFGVFLGGWLMASEFQQGTIRLLMIRPKTRSKILLSKFVAAFIISAIIYLLGSIVNLISNGIFSSFSDFGFPNFTISGEINFFVFYLPKLLLCIVPIFFAFAFAFFLSVTIRNAAVAIVIPMVMMFGSNILMTFFLYGSSSRLNWLTYTPLPYLDVSAFYRRYTSITYALERGIYLNLTYGIILLLALSALCMVASMVIFKKRDINN